MSDSQQEGHNAKRATTNTLALAMSGMLAALVFVATYFLKLPVPMSGGYVHLGDGFILLGASLLGYLAIPAAAVGSLLADLLLGYATYALPTLIIKGGVAAVAVLAMQNKRLWMRVLLLIGAETVMVIGYFLVEWLLMGYGFAGAWVNVGGNAVQGASGVIIALALEPVLRRVKLPKGFR